MLHWQHKSVRNRIRLWLKLALASFIGHVVALTMLFFVYKGSMSDMALTVRAAQLNSTIDVVWVNQLPKGRRPSSARKAKGSSSVRPERAKGMNGKKAKTSGPKTELKSEMEEKKKAKKKEKKSSKPSQAQAERDKKKQLEEKKKLEAKKIEQEKKLEPAPEKKPELEKSIDAIADSSSVPPEVLEGQANTPINHPESDSEDLNFEISGSYRDLEALQQFQELQQEISRCWRPPVGIAQTVCCQIKVTFDWEGKVTQMETVKPSGVLMFDVSSRNAVAAMEAPKFVRGKSFTITFKP